MRRVHYISEFAESLSPDDVEEITRVSAANNARDGITGMLMASGQLFFQLIEGPDEAVDALYNRILGDHRHKNVMVLGDERGDLQRRCPDWSMRKVDLSLDAAVRSEPLKVILEVSAAQYRILRDLVSTLERAMWRQLIEAEADDLDRFVKAQVGQPGSPPGGKS
jgi:adenylate cyclase